MYPTALWRVVLVFGSLLLFFHEALAGAPDSVLERIPCRSADQCQAEARSHADTASVSLMFAIKGCALGGAEGCEWVGNYYTSPEINQSLREQYSRVYYGRACQLGGGMFDCQQYRDEILRFGLECDDGQSCQAQGERFRSLDADVAGLYMIRACELGALSACAYGAVPFSTRLKSYYHHWQNPHNRPAGILGYWHWIVLVFFLIFLVRFSRQHVEKIPEESIAVQYTPPAGLSLLQSALLYDTENRPEDLRAAIMELVQLGHITVDDRLTIHHIRDRSRRDLTPDQLFLLEELFPDGSRLVFPKRDVQQTHRLVNGRRQLNTLLHDWAHREGYFPENKLTLRTLLWGRALIFVAVFLGTIGLLQGIEEGSVYAGLRMAIGVGFWYYFVLFSTYMIPVLISNRFWGWLGRRANFGLASMGVTVLVAVLFGLDGDVLKGEYLAVMGIGGGIGLWINSHLHRLTPRGLAVHRHMLGLHAFITRTHTDPLRRHLDDDPYYIETLLPYAILFGKVDHWVDLYSEE